MAKAYLGPATSTRPTEHYTRAAKRRWRGATSPSSARSTPSGRRSSSRPAKLDEAVERLEQAAAGSRRASPTSKRRPAEPRARHFPARLRAAARRDAERSRDRSGERVTRDLGPPHRQSEPDVFGFALGLAYLDAGQPRARHRAVHPGDRRSAPIACRSCARPSTSSAANFFAAYTLYRDNSPRSRAGDDDVRAAPRKGDRGAGAKIRDLLRSTGSGRRVRRLPARAAPRRRRGARKRAAALAPGDKRRRWSTTGGPRHRQEPGGGRSTLQRFADQMPEALVNLGILADRDGDARAPTTSGWRRGRAGRGRRGSTNGSNPRSVSSGTDHEMKTGRILLSSSSSPAEPPPSAGAAHRRDVRARRPPSPIRRRASPTSRASPRRSSRRPACRRREASTCASATSLAAKPDFAIIDGQCLAGAAPGPILASAVARRRHAQALGACTRAAARRSRRSRARSSST